MLQTRVQFQAGAIFIDLRLLFGFYGCVGFENRYIRDDFAGLYVKNTCAVDAFVIDDHGCLGTVSGVHNQFARDSSLSRRSECRHFTVGPKMLACSRDG